MARTRTDFNAAGVVEAVQQASTERLIKIGAIIETLAKESMPAGGRSIGPKGGKVFTPSAPGTPPNRQYGDLAKSIRSSLNEQRTSVIVGPTLDAWYGRIHEFGGAIHPPRPFMRPALYNSASRFPKEFAGLNLSATQAGRALNSRRQQ